MQSAHGHWLREAIMLIKKVFVSAEQKRRKITIRLPNGWVHLFTAPYGSGNVILDNSHIRWERDIS